MAASMKTCCVRVTGVHCIPARRTVSVAAKPDIHPEYHEESPVFCNGEQVMTVGGTKPKYVVDVYSGNHPLYLGQKGNVVVNNGQLHKFQNKWAGLGDDIVQVGVAATLPGKAIDEDQGKLKDKGKGKGKKGKKK